MLNTKYSGWIHFKVLMNFIVSRFVFHIYWFSTEHYSSLNFSSQSLGLGWLTGPGACRFGFLLFPFDIGGSWDLGSVRLGCVRAWMSGSDQRENWCFMPTLSPKLWFVTPGMLFCQGEVGHSLWRSVLLHTSPKGTAAVTGAGFPWQCIWMSLSKDALTYSKWFPLLQEVDPFSLLENCCCAYARTLRRAMQWDNWRKCCITSMGLKVCLGRTPKVWQSVRTVRARKYLVCEKEVTGV